MTCNLSTIGFARVGREVVVGSLLRGVIVIPVNGSLHFGINLVSKICEMFTITEKMIGCITCSVEIAYYLIYFLGAREGLIYDDMYINTCNLLSLRLVFNSCCSIFYIEGTAASGGRTSVT